MTTLLFNSNSMWFKTSEDIKIGIQIRDGELFEVRCFCYSWSVNDLRQQWGVDDFPRQPALRIANFIMQPAPDDEFSQKEALKQSAYWVLLHPTNSNDGPIPVRCDAVDKQFFGVATDQDSATRVADAEGKTAWLTIKIDVTEKLGDPWAEFSVHRQNSDNWAPAEVKFI